LKFKEHESEREQWKNENEKMRIGAGNQKREVDKKEVGRRNDELEKMRKEIGEIGGSGHFWGNDKGIYEGGVRDEMREEALKKVIGLLAAGEKKINLKEREFRAFLSDKKRKETQKKFWDCHNWEVAEAGWTIQFKTADEALGGDGKYFYLWISNKGKN